MPRSKDHLIYDDYHFKSNFELDFYKKLKRLIRRKDIKLGYEDGKLNYTIYRNYIPDFSLHTSSGTIFIETKGYLRPADRTKLISVKRDNPNIDLRIIFLQDNKLSKKSKTRYSDWAIKNGFDYAIGHIPKEWLL